MATFSLSAGRISRLSLILPLLLSRLKRICGISTSVWDSINHLIKISPNDRLYLIDTRFLPFSPKKIRAHDPDYIKIFVIL